MNSYYTYIAVYSNVENQKLSGVELNVALLGEFGCTLDYPEKIKLTLLVDVENKIFLK